MRGPSHIHRYLRIPVLPAATSTEWHLFWRLQVSNSSVTENYISFVIWLCLTRTGNYQIHEFDWLKWILTAV